MKKWVRGSLFMGIILLGLSASGCARLRSQQRYVQSTTPTLFFHGGGSSYHAETHMVTAAEKAGVTT